MNAHLKHSYHDFFVTQCPSDRDCLEQYLKVNLPPGIRAILIHPTRLVSGPCVCQVHVRIYLIATHYLKDVRIVCSKYMYICTSAMAYVIWHRSVKSWANNTKTGFLNVSETGLMIVRKISIWSFINKCSHLKHQDQVT